MIASSEYFVGCQGLTWTEARKMGPSLRAIDKRIALTGDAFGRPTVVCPSEYGDGFHRSTVRQIEKIVTLASKVSP
jgi:hypothetical protein